MPPSYLKQRIKAAAKVQALPDFSLIPRIDQHLLTAPLVGGRDDRRDGKFHPSDLSTGFCPRAWCLYNFHPQGLAVKESGNDVRLKRIFGNGHGVHERLQRYVSEMGLLWGTWKNPATQETRYGWKPGEGIWEYCEVKLSHDADNITGHTDGLLDLNSRRALWEIKSINARGFLYAKGNGPKQEHRHQAMIYCYCLESRTEVSGFDLEPLAGVVMTYECKDDQALLEWFIPYDREEVENYIGTLRPKMTEAKTFADAFAAKEKGELPPCRCTKYPSPLCKSLTHIPA